MPFHRLVRAVLIAATLIGAPALAANWSFLKDAAIAKFNKDDMALFSRTLESGLEAAPNGKPVTWSNPETGARGSVTVLETRTQGNRRCRKAQVQNKARGSEGSTAQWFCKEASGEWMLHKQP